jgi:hypothetical protein
VAKRGGGAGAAGLRAARPSSFSPPQATQATRPKSPKSHPNSQGSPSPRASRHATAGPSLPASTPPTRVERALLLYACMPFRPFLRWDGRVAANRPLTEPVGSSLRLGPNWLPARLQQSPWTDVSLVLIVGKAIHSLAELGVWCANPALMLRGCIRGCARRGGRGAEPLLVVIRS